MHKYNLIKIIIVTSIFLTSAINAQTVDNRTNAYVGAAHYIFDTNRGQEDDTGFLIGAEMPVTERWNAGLEYWKVTSDLTTIAGSTDLNFYRLASNYHFDMSGKWQPYLGVGLGNYDMDQNVSGTGGRETTLDFGFGVKRFLSDNFVLRGDVRTILGFSDNTTDFAFTLALGYVFGSTLSDSTAVAIATSLPPLDSDADGVMDNEDSCRNTPAGTVVDSRGCEIDSDRDGIVDSKDNCPDTSINLAVDSSGCPILEMEMMHQALEVNFDNDRSNIKPEYNVKIKEFAEFLNEYNHTEVIIEGHTDSNGAEYYNQGLSERRAKAVLDELVNEYGISSSRLSSVGYGENDPVASNTTDEGRARNRRIDAEVSVEVEQEQER